LISCRRCYDRTERPLGPPTEETPFSLTFGAEAVIPVEVGSLSYQVEHYNPGLNSYGMRLHLDLLEERRDKAQTTTAAYQLRTGQYFNKMGRQQCFGVGDWILRKVTLATWDPADTKLGHKWEGPYQVIRSRDREPTTSEQST